MPALVQAVQHSGCTLVHIILIGQMMKGKIKMQAGFLDEFPLRADQVAFARIQRAAGHLQPDIRLVGLRENQKPRAAGQIDVGLVIDVHSVSVRLAGAFHLASSQVPGNRIAYLSLVKPWRLFCRSPERRRPCRPKASAGAD